MYMTKIVKWFYKKHLKTLIALIFLINNFFLITKIFNQLKKVKVILIEIIK